MAISVGNGSLHTRVVITGLGVVSSTGMGRQAFWDAVVEGRSGIRYVTGFDVRELYCRVAGQITDFDPADYMDAAEARKCGRFVHFALAAAEMAVADADIDLNLVPAFRKGAICGTSVAGSGNITDDIYRRYYSSGPRACRPLDHLEMAPHASTARLMIRHGMKGPSGSVASGCCSSLESVAVGANAIRSGSADVMLVGASEAVISEFGLALLSRVNIMTHHNEDPTTACRPYDATRDGIVVSEGAGIVVLESAAHALDRGAHIFAEVAGYGCATEGQHLANADAGGVELAKAIRQALDEARLAPSDIDYVCAHGIANREYDVADMRALKLALGRHAYSIPVSSIKGTTGQPFAAGGAWQITAACMSLDTGIVPPTINYRHRDPDCDLDCVPNRARCARVDTAIVNSHSFGGTHSALILRRFEM